jgi:hypothetical protein
MINDTTLVISGEIKECSKCKRLKSLFDFHKDKYSPGGLTRQCKSCRLKHKKEYMRRIDVKAKRAKHAREFRATNKGKEYINKINKKVNDRIRFGGLREVALLLANSKCTNCNTIKGLCVHHIDGKGRNSINKNNTLSNLTVLCRSCHMKLHRKLEAING